MKKAIIALSIICTGILAISPITFAQNKTNTTTQIVQINEEKTTVNEEEAKSLLEKRNPGIDYVYQGDENIFEVLKEKGLSGYVFLPNIDTDMGLFVDKNTSDIYYFHPSGYLELTK